LDERSSIDDDAERNDDADYSFVAVRRCHRMAAALRSKKSQPPSVRFLWQRYTEAAAAAAVLVVGRDTDDDDDYDYDYDHS